MAVSTTSSTKDWAAVPAGRVAERGVLWEEQPQQPAGGQGSGALAGEIGRRVRPGHPARRAEAQGDRRVQVRAGDFAQRVDHRQHHQAKRQGDAHMRNGPAAGLVDDDRPGAGEHERKGADGFRGKLFHGTEDARPGG